MPNSKRDIVVLDNFIDGNLAVKHFTTSYGHTIERVDTGEVVAHFEYAGDHGNDVYVDGVYHANLREALRTLDVD